jgi:hypothetical protein
MRPKWVVDRAQHVIDRVLRNPGLRGGMTDKDEGTGSTCLQTELIAEAQPVLVEVHQVVEGLTRVSLVDWSVARMCPSD